MKGGFNVLKLVEYYDHDPIYRFLTKLFGQMFTRNTHKKKIIFHYK